MDHPNISESDMEDFREDFFGADVIDEPNDSDPDMPPKSPEIMISISSSNQKPMTFFEWNQLRWLGTTSIAGFNPETARSVLFQDIELYEQVYLARVGTATDIAKWTAFRKEVTDVPFDFTPKRKQAEGVEGIEGQIFTFAEYLARLDQPHTLTQRYQGYADHLKSHGAVADEFAYNETWQWRMDQDRRKLYRSRTRRRIEVLDSYRFRFSVQHFIDACHAEPEAFYKTIKDFSYRALEIAEGCVAREKLTEDDKKAIYYWMTEAVCAQAPKETLIVPLEFNLGFDSDYECEHSRYRP